MLSSGILNRLVMSAYYDTYDYPSYWKGREYEHASEIIAITYFLKKVPKIENILEIGAGFGRLTESYLELAPKITLTDPSSKLLQIASRNIKRKGVRFIHSKLENLPVRFKEEFDLAILVRVLHHLEDMDNCFQSVNQLLQNRGYFILEFPNKCHWKATFREFIKGNFTFLLDIFPIDLRHSKSKRNIPFINYHPEVIKHKLNENGFKIIEVRSVSNFRNKFLKAAIPRKFLLLLEKWGQKPLARINFGPSEFILAQKIG